jgi:hypothetical protein
MCGKYVIDWGYKKIKMQSSESYVNSDMIIDKDVMKMYLFSILINSSSFVHRYALHIFHY